MDKICVARETAFSFLFCFPPLFFFLDYSSTGLRFTTPKTMYCLLSTYSAFIFYDYAKKKGLFPRDTFHFFLPILFKFFFISRGVSGACVPEAFCTINFTLYVPSPAFFSSLVRHNQSNTVRQNSFFFLSLFLQVFFFLCFFWGGVGHFLYVHVVGVSIFQAIFLPRRSSTLRPPIER